MIDTNNAVSLFSKLSSNAKESLGKAMDSIDGGVAPNEGLVNEVTDSLKSLRAAYDTIKVAAAALLETSDDASVESYIEALNDAEVRKAQEARETVVKLLEKFIRVTSDNKTFAEALADSQREAEKTLALIAGKSEDVSVLELCNDEKITRPREAFFEAMEHEDLGDDKGLALIDEIGLYYPRRVEQGLTLGKYYLPAVISTSIGKDGGETVMIPSSDDGSLTEAFPVAMRPGASAAKPSYSPLKKRLGVKVLKRDVLGGGVATSLTFALLSLWPGLSRDQLPLAAAVAALPTENFTPEQVLDAADKLYRDGYLEHMEPLEGVDRYALSKECRRLCKKESVYDAKTGSGVGCWPLKMPCEARRPSIDERFAAAESISGHEASRRYDLLLTSLEHAYKQAARYDRERLKYAMGFCIDRASTLVGNDKIKCELYVAGQATLPTSRAVISFDEMPGEADPQSYDHWFIFEGDQLVDALADKDDSDESRTATDNLAVAEEPREKERGVHEATILARDTSDLENNNCVLEPIKNEATDEPCAPSGTADSGSASFGLSDSVPSAEGGLFVNEEKYVGEPIPLIDYSQLGPKELAAVFVGRREVPSDDEIWLLLGKLFDKTADAESEEVLAFCLTLLESVSFDDKHPRAQTALRQLTLACDSKIGPHAYTGRALKEAFAAIERDNSAMLLAACCHAMLAPKNPYDHELNRFCDSYMDSYDDVFIDLAAAKPLFNELRKIRDISPDKGLGKKVISALSGEKDRARKMDGLIRTARELSEAPSFKVMITGLPEFSESCFGKNSDLGLCMETVADNRTGERGFVEGVLAEYRIGDARECGKVINEKIDEHFRLARSTSRKRGFRLTSVTRKSACDEFDKRLDLMEEWLDLTDGSVDDATLSRLGGLRDSLLQIIDEISGSIHVLESKPSRFILDFLVKGLRQKLIGESVPDLPFSQFLMTGFVTVSNNVPVLDRQHNSVAYCEPWRNVLRHLAADPVGPHEAAVNTLCESSDNFDNIGQLKCLISKFGPFEDIAIPSKDDVCKARVNAEEEHKRFNDYLEMAYAYNKIDENQKEELAELASINEEPFYELEDFASWRRFLKGLRKQVDDHAAAQRDSLKDRLAACDEKLNGAPCPLVSSAKDLFKRENYAVVEEYLNRFDAGEREVDIAYESERDDFSEFISDDVYGSIYSHCNGAAGKPFNRIALDYIKVNGVKANEGSAKSLISNWPTRNERADAAGNKIAAFLKGIGIDAREASAEAGRRYKVTVKPAERNRAQYEHPIAAFGTRMPGTIDVLFHTGRATPSEIIQSVSKQDMTAMSIVLVDAPMRLEDKRILAERFYTQQLNVQFIIIDHVLALYLALHERAERLALALKCSLPFTYYQPFVRDGGATPDEMFFGRSSELRSVRDPGGACVVYGGRQLGKTALLQRAESLEHRPGSKSYAVYVSILNCHSENEAAKTIVDKLRQKTGIDLGTVSSIHQLCDEISARMRNGSISRMLLLIDECDNFLDEISGSSYRALQPLVDLRRESTNNFKFVIAGLHNVCRAKNATENNGIFGQLGSPICIKPLSPMEALQLISRPLTFLGFQVDRYPHLETILTNTNYYPGIIQFFGHILVETMKRHYGTYYRAADNNPPYQLNEAQLGAILNETDLNQSIQEKFRLSLKLDKRYFMLARCIALLCYGRERASDQESLLKGFSAELIKSNAEDLGIDCIASEDMKSLLQLLDEMVEMGILSKPDPSERNYKLRRRSFLNAIGTSEDAILTDIIGDSGGE